jgi:hypothetical protein
VTSPLGTQAVGPSLAAVELLADVVDEHAVVAGLVLVVPSPRRRGLEVRGQSAEVGGQSAEVRGQSAEVGGQSAEVRGQSAEVRGQSAEVGGQSALLR